MNKENFAYILGWSEEHMTGRLSSTKVSSCLTVTNAIVYILEHACNIHYLAFGQVALRLLPGKPFAPCIIQ